MDTAVSVDTRRMTVRVLSQEIIRGLGSIAQMHGGDLIAGLVFTAVWTHNTMHLSTDPAGRYAALRDVPPDSLRVPVTGAELQRVLYMPMDLIERYLLQLIEAGYCEQGPAGYVVPSAVFTRPEMIAGTNEFYARAIGLVSALRNAGFSTGE